MKYPKDEDREKGKETETNADEKRVFISSEQTQLNSITKQTPWLTETKKKSCNNLKKPQLAFYTPDVVDYLQDPLQLISSEQTQLNSITKQTRS